MAGAKATSIKLFLLEDVFFSSDPPSCAMSEPLWSLMPEALVERLLLFLPASSQARFCSVCKRWRELMRTLKFREETALVAFRRGYPVCILNLLNEEEGEEASPAETGQWCKMRKVEMPGLVLPPETKLFSGAGRLPFVGVACMDVKSMDLRCWLLNIAQQTWRELPRLHLAWEGRQDLAYLNWTIWLVPAEGNNNDFCVFLLDGTHPYDIYLHSYSSTSNQWETVYPLDQPWLASADHMALVGKGRYAVTGRISKTGMARLSWDGTPVCRLPDMPRSEFILLADSESDIVFAWGPVHFGDTGVFLYKLKLDESSASSSGWQWECVFSGNLPPLKLGSMVKVINAQIIGHMVLLLARIVMKGTATNWAMAYHMLDGSCRWQRVHLMDEWEHPMAINLANLFVSAKISQII